MNQICINEKACIDVIEVNGAYYANVWIFDTTHSIGPSDDLSLLNRDVVEMLSELRAVARIKASQSLDLKALQGCLLNYKFEEYVN